MQKTKTKITSAVKNAIAHNILIEEVLQSAWDFVTSLGDNSDFDYAFVNSAAEDYMDTCWHTTQNVKINFSLLQQDEVDMYDNAKTIFVNNFVDENLADLTAEYVYASLDDISGDTAMRENYYARLREHFANFVKDNKHFALQETEYKGCYKLVTTATAKKKSKIALDYLNRWDCEEYIEMGNEIASY